MTIKEAMAFVYSTLGDVVLVERDEDRNIFSSGAGHMVVIMDGDNGLYSPVFQTLEEAQAWLPQ
jgi:hypothetical protein